MQPHNTTAIIYIEIEDSEVPVKLELEYVPESKPPKDWTGRYVEPYEPGGYIIQGAQWQNPFDDPADWEAVPGVMLDIIKKNEFELLERWGVAA